MNNSEYTISATLPIQTGKGKVEIPEENATKKANDPKGRNEKYGYIEIKAIAYNRNEKEAEKTARETGEGR